MKFYGNRFMMIKDAAEIDHDIIAFNVAEEDVEEVTDYLLAAIITKSIMETGMQPELFE